MTRRFITFGIITTALVAFGAAFGIHAFSDTLLQTTSGNSKTLTIAPEGDTDVDVDIDGFANWALLDRSSGDIEGANLKETSTPQSMIKPWLVADYLRQAESDAPPLLDSASAAIRISDDEAAQTIYEELGEDASIERLISTCALTDTTVFPGRWSKTEMSVRDAARMGECVADGRAAGPWTKWLLNEMRHVRGSTADEDQHATSGGGRWGIIDGLPASLRDEVAIKNGWTRMADGDWDLNCLAIHDDWVLAIMMGYSGDRSLDYGADRCRAITEQLFGSGA
ncbi:hypothetical protein Snas_5344 [Stackebrandtia nassauensis DSM 44728]|uniref:Uncharacterized protein n=2 Tax=Stackebrandtia TaxID=283810 RepID=D3PUV4_STANL|nr:hypothetical protein Snas_5344 [Stackebrandtia nassauensis DSM 44728]